MKRNKKPFKKLERKGDVLYKHYSNEHIARRDACLLTVINQHFYDCRINGWRYRALQKIVHHPGEKMVSMEFVNGLSMKKLFIKQKDPSCFRHMGIWLGVLHRSHCNDGKVLTFTDFTRRNIMIDPVAKEVVAIDPGDYCSVLSHPGVAFVKGLDNCFRASFAENLNLVIKSMFHFTYGYLLGKGEPCIPGIWPGVKHFIFRAGRSKEDVLLINNLLGNIVPKKIVRLKMPAFFRLFFSVFEMLAMIIWFVPVKKKAKNRYVKEANQV